MPFDPQRLARVRAHLLTAAAIAAAGCGGNAPPDHTVNEPVHINAPPESASPPPSDAPTATLAPDLVPHTINEAPQLGPAPTAAPTSTAAVATGGKKQKPINEPVVPVDIDRPGPPPDPIHVNTPVPKHINTPAPTKP